MYVYQKKNTKSKALTVVGLTLVLIVICGAFLANYILNQNKYLPISAKDPSLPVLTLPSTVKVDEVAVLPFAINAKQVNVFFEASKSEEKLGKAITNFEGVYRPNQGIDYSFDSKVFEVTSILSGKVVEIKEDAILGKSVVIEQDGLKITYQSLSKVNVKKDQVVKQKDVIGLSGENIYNKDLGIHLHVVVQRGESLIDPELIYGKKLVEIK